MTAAIYARVSTKDKGQTNENQLRELRAFAARVGYFVYKEYCDQESGGSAERPEFQQLFVDAHSGALTWCCSGVSTASAARA